MEVRNPVLSYQQSELKYCEATLRNKGELVYRVFFGLLAESLALLRNEGCLIYIYISLCE